MLTVAFALGGCSILAPIEVPSESEIIGTWRYDESGTWGEPGGTIVFSADGTFAALDMPEDLRGGTGEAIAVDREGRWAIDDGSVGDTPGYYDPGVIITYAIDDVRNQEVRLQVDGNGDHFRLRHWHDYDIPEYYILVKLD